MRSKLIVALIVAISPTLVHADPSAANLLAAMRQAYAEVKTAHFTTTSEFLLAAKAKKTLAVTADIFFASPNKVKVTQYLAAAKSPKRDYITVADGKSIVNIISGKVLRKVAYSTDRHSRVKSRWT